MINPYNFTRLLLSIPSFASLIDEPIIKLLSKNWVIKAKTSTETLATIRLTKFNTLEFTIPIANIDDVLDEELQELSMHINNLNGVISFIQVESLMLYYTTYFPSTIVEDYDSLHEYGEIIKEDIKFINSKLNSYKKLNEEEIEQVFSADTFNEMLKQEDSEDNNQEDN